MIKSYLFSLLILLFAVLIETAVLSNIPLLPAVPDLVLICSLYFALNNGSVQGQTMGFAGGLLVDFLSGTLYAINCKIILPCLQLLLQNRPVFSQCLRPFQNGCFPAA